jgi:hypothetical protein
VEGKLSELSSSSLSVLWRLQRDSAAGTRRLPVEERAHVEKRLGLALEHLGETHSLLQGALARKGP